MSGDIAPEIVERMVDHLRKCAAEPRVRPNSLHRELMEIVALLPKPVHPDLVEARKIVSHLYEGQGVTHLAAAALTGEGDDWFNTKCALAAIKRGRELEASFT